MAYTEMKRVRLTRAEANRLARLAKETRSSESDVLRRGLLLVEEMTRRDKAIDRLMELAEIKGPDKERYKFR